MSDHFVLPLFPLEEAVLLPGGQTSARGRTRWERGVLAASRSFGDTVIASLKDGESVHEIGVTARVDAVEDEVRLRGLDRCRLLALVRDDLPMVEAEAFSEGPPGHAAREAGLGRLLSTRFQRLCRNLGLRRAPAPVKASLAALTWQVVGGLGLSVEQQQGFLAVPDSLTRGRLLLVAVRELERRERFLRPWAHLRQTAGWN